MLPPGSRSFGRMADSGHKDRWKTARGAKADKPKRYDPASRLQESEGARRTFVAGGLRGHLRWRGGARMLF